MTEFLAAIIAFPTIFYTGLLALAAVYWVFVIVGALDVDLLDPSAAADGAIKGALEGAGDAAGALKGVAEGAGGALKGVAEGAGGALKGVAEGASGALKGVAESAGDALGALKGVGGGLDAADGLDGATEALDGAADGALEGADGAAKGVAELAAAKAGKLQAASEAAGLFGVSRIKDVPVTVTGSFWILWAWAFSFLGMQALAPALGGVLGNTALGILVMLAAGALGVPVSRVCARPFAGVFTTEEAQKSESLVGQIVQVSTGRVDAGFGQANLEDGQAGLLLQVRCPKKNSLARGDDALIVDYDPTTNTFTIEPLEPELAQDEPQRQRAMARLERERS